jgi:hypothetical protein
LADAITLEPVKAPSDVPTAPTVTASSAKENGVVALIAAFQGEVRLIDNMVLKP